MNLEVCHLKKHYAGQTVLEDFSLTLPSEGVTALCGPSGQNLHGIPRGPPAALVHSRAEYRYRRSWDRSSLLDGAVRNCRCAPKATG